jgi:ABC-2 type transport system permease protein
MLALLKKELGSYFSSVTGYVAIIVFLIVNGLFMWVFPGELNLLDAGYANIDTLFLLAPWIFLFLVPAVTMRTFAGEKEQGTIELLLTRPVSDLLIIVSKYLAGILVVMLALLPLLIAFWSIVRLGNPPGNIDMGATWGSFIGLFLLAAIYASIGIFSSSLTTNPVIAFILAAILCFFFFIGFESIGSLFYTHHSFINNLGINAHYQSIRRGVVDLRDITYFISVVLIFLYASRLVLQSRKW